MDVINLIISNPISVIAISAIGLFVFVAKRNITINEDRAFFKSLAENKDKELNSVLVKIEVVNREHNHEISSINDAHNKEIEKLTHKINSFEKDNEIDISKLSVPTANHW
jgi:hypothetical protein